MRSYSPSRGPKVRPGHARRERADLERLTWFVLLVRPQTAVRDYGGPDGETEAERDHRLATRAERALREAGSAIGCGAAFIPTEALWRSRNGFDVRRRSKTAYLKPIMPGYLFAGFSTHTPPWATIETLLDGMTIRGAVTWTTLTHPEGEPRPLTFAALAKWAASSANPIMEAPEHHRVQPTGRELNVDDIVKVPHPAFEGWTAPIKMIVDDIAVLELVIAGKAHRQEYPLETLERAA